MADKSDPEYWSAKVASDVLRKTIEDKGKPLDSEKCLSTQSPKDLKTLNADVKQPSMTIFW